MVPTLNNGCGMLHSGMLGSTDMCVVLHSGMLLCLQWSQLGGILNSVNMLQYTCENPETNKCPCIRKSAATHLNRRLARCHLPLLVSCDLGVTSANVAAHGRGKFAADGACPSNVHSSFLHTRSRNDITERLPSLALQLRRQRSGIISVDVENVPTHGPCGIYQLVAVAAEVAAILRTDGNAGRVGVGCRNLKLSALCVRHRNVMWQLVLMAKVSNKTKRR